MRRTKHDWRREVWRSKLISDSTRVLLLFLADHMRADLEVSVARSEIAAALGRNDRRIAERFRIAEEVGFLDRIAAGMPGRTAVYRGTFPDGVKGADGRTPAKGADSSTHWGADGRTVDMSNVYEMHPDKGADGGRATKAALPATRVPNGGNEDTTRRAA